MIEIYEIIDNITPLIIDSLFLFRENVHNIRNFQIVSSSTNKTVRYRFETVSYRSLFLWGNLPQDYKSQTSLIVFKAKLRNWNAGICECRLCKHYEGNLGFI